MITSTEELKLLKEKGMIELWAEGVRPMPATCFNHY